MLGESKNKLCLFDNLIKIILDLVCIHIRQQIKICHKMLCLVISFEKKLKKFMDFLALLNIKISFEKGKKHKQKQLTLSILIRNSI